MSSGSVKDFYDGKTIFITGGTGYIGRVLIGKLMRMGNLQEILLLSRPKKGKSNDKRLSKILSGFLFEDMEKFDPKFRSKLRLVNGDLESFRLGISDDDLEYIKDRVEVIIHGAATVRFDEELIKAIRINILGTKCILDIATECTRLQSLVHISTGYSNCPRSKIEEAFYESPMDYRRALELLNFNEFELAPLTMKIIAPWPNTYTFTKAVSEDMIRQYQAKLTIAIIRPSVVISTMRDPVAGYADSILGLLGVGIACSSGLLRVMKATQDTVLDLVPSDIVVNFILTIACLTSRSRNQTDKRIFNCCYGDIFKQSFAHFSHVLLKNAMTNPVKQMLWYPNVTLTASDTLFRFYYFLFHFVPAFFVDIILRFKKSKYRLVSVYSKIYFQIKLMSYFTDRMWAFQADNRSELFKIMTEQDHQEFPVKATYEECLQATEAGTVGWTTYFFNQTDQETIQARKKYKILFVLHYAFLAILYSGLFYVLYQMFGNRCLRMLPVIETF